jgi:predicted nucleic acid-binding protein
VTVYLDTSSLVKLYIDAPGTDEVARLVHDADVVVTSVLAYPEVRATLARRRREGLLKPKEYAAVVAQFDADWPRFVTLALGGDLAYAAGQLADTHRLRGGDAAHLASFELMLTGAGTDDVRFSCADDRLSKAARSLG